MDCSLVCFSTIYGIFKSKKQGEEISIEGENWPNSTSYGAYFSNERDTWDIQIMLSAMADQNLLGMQILDFNIERCMSQASKINIDEKQGQ